VGILLAIFKNSSIHKRWKGGWVIHRLEISSVLDVLVTMQANPTLFKNLTNFATTKFKKLAFLMVPTIISHVRSIGEAPIVLGKLLKLSCETWLLNFVLFLKHD
jgi:hypothetical protein